MFDKNIVKEKLPLIIDKCPHNNTIKEGIIKENLYFSRSRYNADGNATNVKALQTPQQTFSPSIKLITDLVVRNLVKVEGKGKTWFIEDCWVSLYNKGDYAIRHSHNPAYWSFVYFITCPRGSSPLVFSTSGKRIKAEEGKVVLFPGWVRHHVPKNNCEGRMVCAGNVAMKFNQ
tara:strand:+ start:436 stop:957 length:522 start_codon:yes stop_codon:yes gene_type:complete